MGKVEATLDTKKLRGPTTRLIAVTTNDPPFRDESRASGVYLSRDGGATWSRENLNLPVTRGRTLAFDPHRPGRLVLGTTGRGFFVARVPRDG